MAESGGDEGKDLYPIAVLIDALRDEKTETRLNSVAKLDEISKSLGPARTRDELLPYVLEIEDEDEVLLVLAEKLGSMLGHVGGDGFANHLLVPLEALCMVEEVTVREKAVESIRKLVQELPKQSLVQVFVPLLQRLCQKDWFSSRISACGLFGVGYKALPAPTQDALTRMFTELCQDEAPMVRRAAASSLGRFCEQIQLPHLQAKMIPLFVQLSKDDQDSVRLLAINNCVTLSGLLPKTTRTEEVLAVALRLSTDPCWRVRWSVATKYIDLCKHFDPKVIEELMLGAFEKLLQDSEAEVRTAAASKVVDFTATVSVTAALDKILPCLRGLVDDPNEHVRSALASVIMGLAPILEKEHTIAHLVPLFLRLLKDSNSEVRLNIISKLQDVNQVVGIELLSQSLFPAIEQLAEDHQWRVRLAIIQYIPLLAESLGVAFFDKKLGRLCLSWLSDSVCTIRKAATANLGKLADLFGPAWASEHIVPAVLKLQGSNSYLLRITMLNAVAALGSSVSTDVLKNTLLPVVLATTKDSVANVRFNAATALQHLLARLPSAADQIVPCLKQMQTDSDIDVKYYASPANAQLIDESASSKLVTAS